MTSKLGPSHTFPALRAVLVCPRHAVMIFLTILTHLKLWQVAPRILGLWPLAISVRVLPNLNPASVTLTKM